MRVFGISTGTVDVKASQIIGRSPGRLLHVLFDKEWVNGLPILVWVIEHPDGTILVDTGETSRTAEPGYFPRWQIFFRLAVRMHVAKEDEIGARLRAHGLDPQSVSRVILTHLHTDHAGGVADLRGSEFFATEKEIRLSRSPFAALNGVMSRHFPEWFEPKTIRFDDGPLGPFPQSCRFTSDGVVSIVPTPGHTAGHCSVIVRIPDGPTLFLAGDASDNQAAMMGCKVDGLSKVPHVTRRTLRRIKEFVDSENAVYLPAHDPESLARLAAATDTPIPSPA